MDKRKLCKEIGDFFGNYFEENNQYCIDNGLEVFRYDSTDDLLKDWVSTLIENQHDTSDNPGSAYRVVNDSWEQEIVFIYSEVFGKPPSGVRFVEGSMRWESYADIHDGSKHGKNLHLGTYSSIVDAIYARKAFFEQASRCDRNTPDYVEQICRIAKSIKEKASDQRQCEKTQAKETEIRAQYDLSSPEGVANALRTANKRALDGSDKNVYESGWVNGYAACLKELSKQWSSRVTPIDEMIQDAAMRNQAEAVSHYGKQNDRDVAR